MSDSKDDTLVDSDKSEDLHILNESTKGAYFLLLVQIFTKLITFLLNQLIIRFISPRVFGIAAYFEFAVSNILFLSREAVRLSVQRTESHNLKSEVTFENYHENTAEGALQSVINFGYLPSVICIPILLIFLTWQYYSQMFQHTISQTSYYHFDILLITFSIILELLSEPYYLKAQYQLEFKKRSKFESYSILIRCVTTFLGIVLIKNIAIFSSMNYDGLAVLSFCFGQLSYSLCKFFSYFFDFVKSNNVVNKNSIKIQKIYSLNSFYFWNPKIMQIWKSIFIQMIFKQLLTEGDILLMSYICTVEEQGVYSVITNYGSLFARLIFQTIEESFRLLFTKFLSTRSKQNISDSFRAFKYLCLFYLNLSILIIVGGSINGSFLLRILLGGKASQWENTNIFEIFPQYIGYIPFLAFNGILEAFFSSVATEKEIKNMSMFMSISTILVLILSFVLIDSLKMGLTGLIIANVTNMSLRIFYCAIYCKNFYSQFGIDIPFFGLLWKSKSKLLVALLAYAAHFILEGTTSTSSFECLFKSICICIILLFSLVYMERKLVIPFLMKWKDKLLAKRVSLKED